MIRDHIRIQSMKMEYFSIRFKCVNNRYNLFPTIYTSHSKWMFPLIFIITKQNNQQRKIEIIEEE